MRNVLLLIASSMLLVAAACSDSSSAPDEVDDDASPGSDAGADASFPSDAAADKDANVVVDSGFIPQLDGAAPSTRFKAISKEATTAPNGFYEYLPAGYDGSLAAPLMVFWHGVGEDGDGLAEADGGGDLHFGSEHHDETTMPQFIACPEPRDDVKFNVIDGGGHDVWTKTYDLSYGLGDVYQWMLDHPKK